MKYSLIIPIYNEEGSISSLYSGLRQAMSGIGRPYEIVFVDDGSTDSSLKRLKEIFMVCDDLVIIVLERHAGKAEALQAGFDNAQEEIIITLDGDGQNDPRDIPALLNKMDEGYDVVYGWRYRRQDPFPKKAAAKIAALVRRVIIGREPVSDVGCALRVFRKEDIAGVRLSGGLHRFFSVIMARQGYRVGQIKVSHYPRKAGVSKYGTFDRLVKGIADCFRISLMDTAALMAHKSRYSIREVLRKSSNQFIP